MDRFPRLPKTDQHSHIPDNEASSFTYDWVVPGFSRPLPVEFSANTDLISPSEDLVSSITRESSIKTKIQIPRSAQAATWTSAGRTSRACENCREQKAKCSGHHPTCKRCEDAGIRCFYSDRKKDKVLKELDSLKTQTQNYEAILREVYPRLDPLSAHYVDQTLGEQSVRLSSSSVFSSEPPAGIGHPLAIIDHTEEDFNRDENQATGYVGEHSEMAWLYRLKQDLDQETPTHIKQTPNRPSISSLNYFQGDMEPFSLKIVDEWETPPQHIADRLVESYLRVVHPDFPIIGKGIFLSQYRLFYSKPKSRPGRRWKAVLNLVFAIASKHSSLVNNSPREDIGDHMVYFSRAWRLSLGDIALLDHPNLQQVQVEGLAAFYLLASGNVNRSWRMIGIAVRSALAMGLNLRSESFNIAHFSKENRYRVWWALFMLDTVLCVITGRPPSYGNDFCTTPRPIPFREEDFGDEEVRQLITDFSMRQNLLNSLLSQGNSTGASKIPVDNFVPPSSKSEKGKQSAQANPTKADSPAPNISLYFLYAVDLAFLMREAIETLYAPGATRRCWGEMENAISTFNKSADIWLTRLPIEFHFAQLDLNHPFARQRASLAFRFYTTKIVISQPCLRRIAHQPPGSTSPGPICDTMASICVEAARKMLSTLPDRTNASLLYEVFPWWCVLHYIMQSFTIILVEYLMRTEPGTIEAADLLDDIRKAVNWLREMATRDPSSQRAWSVCVDILSQRDLDLHLEVN
ncbi:transcriptional regulator family: Fungal Specific TF [Penicillium roqueforti]|nr:transcriptional regulator family: Fungal Specific TF [Penicillium roqueforti]